MKDPNKAVILPSLFEFPGILPINTLDEGLRLGGFKHHFVSGITKPFRVAEGPKKLTLVCFNRNILDLGYIALLRGLSKKPCRDAPQYLLGLLASVPETKMPEGLRNRDFLSAEPGASGSVFLSSIDRSAFLCVLRRENGYRELNLASINNYWSEFWAFLAEDL